MSLTKLSHSIQDIQQSYEEYQHAHPWTKRPLGKHHGVQEEEFGKSSEEEEKDEGWEADVENDARVREYLDDIFGDVPWERLKVSEGEATSRLDVHPDPDPDHTDTVNVDRTAKHSPRTDVEEQETNTRSILESERRRFEKSRVRDTDALNTLSDTITALRSEIMSSIEEGLSNPARKWSLQRWEIMDQMGGLRAMIYADADADVDVDVGEEGVEARGDKSLDPDSEVRAEASTSESATRRKEKNLYNELERAQTRLRALKNSRQWSDVLERVIGLSNDTLSALSSSPPLRTLSTYHKLHTFVSDLETHLPPSMSLVTLAQDVRRETWSILKGKMVDNLLEAVETISWPKSVDYPSVPLDARKRFEHSFRDLLKLQLEAEMLWSTCSEEKSEEELGHLYAFEALVRPVSLRFRYHFQTDRPTNRLDKPEWAFTNILDLLFDQKVFIEDYLQPLLNLSGFSHVNAKSELVSQLLRLPLDLLRRRMPYLLDHPPLLAHTIYQTVVFDDAVRQSGFHIDKTYARAVRDGAHRLTEDTTEWLGVTDELLMEEDWYERWLKAEKVFTDEQYNEIVSSPEAWTLVDAAEGLDLETENQKTDRAAYRPTRGARQVKALVDQVTDRYSNLPSLRYKYPFLCTIQIPLLLSFHSRIASSLDAFETLSSAFLRVVPGAPGPQGIMLDQKAMTSGVAGLERLTRAWVSASWIRDSMQRWDDEPVYLELYNAIIESPDYRHYATRDEVIGSHARPGSTGSIFEIMLGKYRPLVARAEDMIVKHVTSEVERELKQHLTRRWDAAPSSVNEETTLAPDASLLVPVTTLSSQLAHLNEHLPQHTVNQIYREIISHLSNHIQQRAVFSGWSKFTESGGKNLAAEIDVWVEACSLGGIKRPEGPWRKLREMAKILALPVEPREGEDSLAFSQAMALALGGGVDKLRDVLELSELDGQVIQSVVRRRVECKR